jgi:elongator complex protein 3
MDKSVFEKTDSHVYEVRPEVLKLSKEVILALYDFISIAGDEMLDKRRVEKIRNALTKKHKLTPPRNIELIQAYNQLIEDGHVEANDTILGFIIKRKVRTLSGIANITVMLKAFGCPGKCIFCPTQPGMPKSYFSTQPAMMRAVRNDFNSYMQVKARLNGLKTQGHDITKIDVRTAGGTWGSYLLDYQEFFIKSIYFALNEGPGPLLSIEESSKLIDEKTLEELITENETASSRCVGLWIETRPDWVDDAEITRLRRYGVTGIELGIQTTTDSVNDFNKRGHGLAESIEATNLAREAGLKICHHLMPNLPTSTVELDLKTVYDSFELDGLKPDHLKVYPCMVVPYTELAKMVETDPTLFVPYENEELLKILIEINKIVPEYCRIIRMLRDFPSELILSGTKTLNLRQIIEQNPANRSRDIRSREIKDSTYDSKDVKIIERPYTAGYESAQEIFISVEDTKQDKLLGLVRLRLPKKYLDFIPELKDCAVIRELHVYGQQKTLKKNNTNESKTQHKGYGRQLMEHAELLATQNGYKKIAVISAIGTREYYRKLGYTLEGTYMIKSL